MSHPKNESSKKRKQSNRKPMHSKRIGRKNTKFYAPFWSILAMIFFIAYLLSVYLNSTKKTNNGSYQVLMGSNMNTFVYNAMIFRDEELVSSPMDGYINYYTQNGERVGANAIVCSMDRDGTFFQRLKEELGDNISTLDKDSLKKFQQSLKNFSQSFDLMQYESIYSGKYTLSSDLMEILNDKIFEEIAQTPGGDILFDAIRTSQPGIVMFNYDNMTETKPESITQNILLKENYTWKSIAAGEQVKSGETLYRIVKSDAFSIVFLLNEQDKLDYFDTKEMTVSFKEENMTLTGSYSHYIGSDGQRYGMVSFKGGGYSLLNKRYVNIQITDNFVEGLKIPVTSIVQREYYRIPNEYITYGSNETAAQPQCIVLDSNQQIMRDIEVIVKYENYSLVSIDYFKPGEILVPAAKEGEDFDHSSSASEKTYTVYEKVSIYGVYEINRGYTIFRTFSKKVDNCDGFCIIDMEKPYTIREYDWIAIDGALYEEGELIY